MATATGGTITEVGGYKIHTFTAGDNFVVSGGSIDVEYLIVAGGGAGGNATSTNQIAGNGGAGGLLTNLNNGLVFLISGSYPVVVGNGGQTSREDGGNSSFNSLTAIGGGGGGQGTGSGIRNGRNGGSGGSAGGGGNGGLGVVGQGTNGNDGFGNPAGGATASTGAGVYSGISGETIGYAGGGGPTESSEGVLFGGGVRDLSPGVNGTGGGGGGKGFGSSGSGLRGGSGIVIIRYLLSGTIQTRRRRSSGGYGL